MGSSVIPDDVLVTTSDLAVVRGSRSVLHGVDLTVSRGEVVAVLGPNGAGKSSLFGALSGALPAARGSVTRHGRVASLLQTPGLANRSAQANVELALAWWGVPKAARRERAAEALGRMRAGHLAQRHAATLSGGERRRVHLARAIGVAADVLLLDEPFDGLDPGTHAQLRDDVVDAVRQSASATMIVLHDRADVWAVADRVIVLVDGTVHADDTPERLSAAPPTVETARLFGYDGEIRTASGSRLLTRSSDVRPDVAGSLVGRVTRVVPTEHGSRVLVAVPGGEVWALHDRQPSVRVGDEMRLSVTAQVEFR